MKKTSKLAKPSEELEEVRNAELQNLKGGGQSQDEHIYTLPSTGTNENEQLLAYATEEGAPDGDGEQWDVQSLTTEEWGDDEWSIQAFREGAQGEFGEGEPGEEEPGEPGETIGIGEDGEPVVVITPEEPSEPIGIDEDNEPIVVITNPPHEPEEEPWEPWEPVEEPGEEWGGEEDWGGEEPSEDPEKSDCNLTYDDMPDGNGTNPQFTNATCGPHVLSALSKMMGENKSFEDIVNHFAAERSGETSGIEFEQAEFAIYQGGISDAEYASYIDDNFDSTAIGNDYQSIQEAIQSGKPVMAHFVTGPEYDDNNNIIGVISHAVIIDGVTSSGGIRYYDPMTDTYKVADDDTMFLDTKAIDLGQDEIRVSCGE